MSSKSTGVISVRLRKETIDAIQRRAENYPGEMTVSGYIRMTLEYMVHRKHKKTRGI